MVSVSKKNAHGHNCRALCIRVIIIERKANEPTAKERWRELLTRAAIAIVIGKVVTWARNLSDNLP